MGRELFVVKGMEKPDWPTKKKKRKYFFLFLSNRVLQLEAKFKAFHKPAEKLCFCSIFSFSQCSVFYILPPHTCHSPWLSDWIYDRESSEVWNVIFFNKIFYFQTKSQLFFKDYTQFPWPQSPKHVALLPHSLTRTEFISSPNRKLLMTSLVTPSLEVWLPAAPAYLGLTGNHSLQVKLAVHSSISFSSLYFF